MYPKELRFDLEDIQEEIPVTVPDSKGGVTEYKLVSISGQDATTYQNARASSIKFDQQGRPVGFSKIADLAPLLVSLCLRREDGGKVSKSVVGSMPHKVQKKLFEVAQSMNQLNEEVRYTEAMVEVFGADDSPVNIEEVREWLSDQDEENTNVRLVSMLFKESDEELVKNSQNGTMDGST